jgi:hypothetical protein
MAANPLSVRVSREPIKERGRVISGYYKGI